MRSVSVKKEMILAIFILLVTLTTNAQQDNPIINLPEHQVTVNKALALIEEQTGYVIGRETGFDSVRQINLDKRSYMLSELLDIIIKDTDWSYTIRGRNVSIGRGAAMQEEEVTTVVASVNDTQSIFGRIQAFGTDKNVGGASVIISGATKHSLVTDSLGRYSFENISEGNYLITVSHKGYITHQTEQMLHKGENLKLSFLLEPDCGEEQRVWSASLAYPDYKFETKLDVKNFNNYIPPFQKQRIPVFAIKTNLLADAILAPSLGVEFKVSKRLTLDLPIIYKPFTLNKGKGELKESRLFIVQPELRFWQEPFNGHFWGVHLIYAQYNIAGYKFPLGIYPSVKNYRYDGNLYGVGVSYGYSTMLSRSLNLEFNVGFGYGYTDYKRYTCTDCNKYVDKNTKHYFGPTKAGISLVYILR